MCSGGGAEKSCSRSGQARGSKTREECGAIEAVQQGRSSWTEGEGEGKGAAEGPGLTPAEMGSAGLLRAARLWCRVGAGSPGGGSREVRGTGLRQDRGDLVTVSPAEEG